jgi:endonuclease/exonuclease/phosphatase family metal-dependent hydrolase
VLLFNEVPIGLSGALHRSLGGDWSCARTPSARFAGMLPFQQAILTRGRTLSFVASVGLGAGRKLLVTRLTNGSQSMVVAVAHLSAEIPVVGRRRRARERQLDRLVHGLRPLLASGEPIVLGGDFNFIRQGGREPEHERATALLGDGLGLVDVAEPRAGGGQVPDATWPSRGHVAFGLGPQRLDLFYLSTGLAGLVRSLEVLDWPYASTGSDHRPLLLELDLD